MAVVIRFNTVLVRKKRIEATYLGGLDEYRRDLLSEGILFYEDAHLAVAVSMGPFYDYWDRLGRSGLIHEDGDRVVDIVTADEISGVDPRCDWLESKECCGYPVCWLAGGDAGYIVDVKSGRFLKRVADIACSRCAAVFQMGAAVQAVDIEERRSGPFAVVHGSPGGLDAEFAVSCTQCGHESGFNGGGRSVDLDDRLRS